MTKITLDRNPSVVYASSMIDNAYPSTSDIPLRAIAGGQDLVLATLEGARKRYKRHGTQDGYIGFDGAVCAVGAVFKEVGVTEAQSTGIICSLGGPLEIGVGGYLKAARVETDLRKAAEKAIKLLNKAAVKLYDCADESWSGPIEALNQNLGEDEFKEAVLECYDEAIADRKKANRRKAAKRA